MVKVAIMQVPYAYVKDLIEKAIAMFIFKEYNSTRRLFLLLLPAAIIFLAASPLVSNKSTATRSIAGKSKKWKSLFNGKDFSGWDSHLNKPLSSIHIPGLEKDSTGEYTKRLGLNNDPLHVFSVVKEDGAAAIRVSGQIFGYIVSKESFSDFHLRLQFKWGLQKWAPRLNEKRDAGLLYYSVGQPEQHPGTWMTSQECQIQEGDCGDFWPIGNTRIDIPSGKSEDFYQYHPDSLLTTFGNGTVAGPRCAKHPDNEKPNGEWNTVEVISFNGNSVHLINGKITMRLFNSRLLVNGTEEPLKAGRIQLQSEGAEIFYRNIEVVALSKIPPVLKDFKLKKQEPVN
jgi:hypothetical protein